MSESTPQFLTSPSLGFSFFIAKAYNKAVAQEDAGLQIDYRKALDQALEEVWAELYTFVGPNEEYQNERNFDPAVQVLKKYWVPHDPNLQALTKSQKKAMEQL